jgi:hypothetical protein
MESTFFYKGKSYTSILSITKSSQKSYYDVFLNSKTLQNKFRPHLTLWRSNDNDNWGFAAINGVNARDLQELMESINKSLSR